ncbi:putative pre-16S rRNA nuclease [Mesoterricola silvestris]|uniref:Putative pre-16S rRNA nuclease n=2 Tax=Mesoterricola silvestris TaxID=2927979 RepID=A0AA48KA85_9BACT|nr:putative pre-16S rRNA nuclease [Mesoterricola silvestris]
MRWMGLDHGTKNIGIAFTDDLEILASPFEVWPNQGEASLARLARLAKEEGAQALLVGLPLHKDGAESATAPLARKFGEALRDRTGLPLVFWDERLTSVEAERLLAARGVKAKDRKARLDAAAAAVMLADLIETRRAKGRAVGSAEV